MDWSGYGPTMLTIVIPTLNAEATLRPTLASLVPGVLSGLVKQLVICDGGSTDGTLEIAEEAGADIVNSVSGRGLQLAAGARQAKADWLLFLHADTLLEPGWEYEVAQFIGQSEHATPDMQAAYFRFRLNDRSAKARWLERVVSWRCWLFALPYGDQGLLIEKSLYERLGGYQEIPLMEDVDLVRRIGRSRLTGLGHNAVTGADRYRHDGYIRRMARNLSCLTLYFAGVSPERILRIYR